MLILLIAKRISHVLLLLGTLFLMFNACEKKILMEPKDHIELHPTENYFTLYVIPSPFGINWQNPHKLFTSMVVNYFSFYPHFMGHVGVELNCQDLQKKTHQFYTGMTYQKMPALKKIFIEQAGLGILFEKWPGVEDSSSTFQSMQYRLKNPGAMQGISFLSFQINAETCNRLVQYYDEFKQNNIGRYYSLYSRPLYGEGAGCSAYGASFLEVAGILLPEFKEAWTYELSLLPDLIGTPFRADQKVPFWKFLSPSLSWAQAHEGFSFSFWEPDKMHRWITQQVQYIEKNPSALLAHQYPQKIVKKFKTNGLLVDIRNLKTPQQPIWSESDRPFFSELKNLNQNLYPHMKNKNN